MSGLTFKGGIHTYDGKDLTKDKKIIDLLPSSPELVFPLSQHIGAPAEPVVNVGDRVLPKPPMNRHNREKLISNLYVIANLGGWV